MYPQVEISSSRLKENTISLKKLLVSRNMDMWAVTKCFCAIPEVAEVIVSGGVEVLADSRIQNLKKLRDIKARKVLLRIPMQHEVDEVVEWADYSLNSELETLRLLGSSALKAGKTHRVVIMVDLGDLREGVWADEIEDFVAEAVKIVGISIRGFGVNLTCYGGVIPDEENLGRLVKIARDMQDKFGLEIEIISGGNSSSLYLLKNGRLPEGINNLRIGEALLLGRETAFGNPLEDLNQDVFILKAQIVELKEKPSVPIGRIGMDAFGNVPYHEDRGVIKRGIIAVGRQDIDPAGLMPADGGLDIIGASSDHTIIDFTNSPREYKVGDIVEFSMDYGCLLRAMTSEYMGKLLVR